MNNIPSSKIVFQDKESRERDFRYPEAKIAGVSQGPPLGQTIFESKFESDESPSQYNQEVGVPRNLRIDFQRRRKKGTSTFIDAFILFDPAVGATSHEFRVSKIPSSGEIG
jgi:hypothetical protein